VHKVFINGRVTSIIILTKTRVEQIEMNADKSNIATVNIKGCML